MALEPPALSRIVALIDMDCFYCACERALQPDLVGQPLVVVQYNPYQGDGSASESGVKSFPAEPASARVVVRRGQVLIPSSANGGIIAVSYEARAQGVTRYMRGREACATCPELTVVQVPTAHGKSDMGLYRTFGAKVRHIVGDVCGKGSPIEKASVDEMYVDLTEAAKLALKNEGVEALVKEAAEAGTHVAGAEEGAKEASMEQQPQTAPLGRSAFRAGHAGQVHQAMASGSVEWWARPCCEWPNDEAMLAAGAAITARARAKVTAELGFTCSAGVAANKLLAKLGGGLHKPNQQTVLPTCAVFALLDPLPVDRLRGFGGKLGELLKNGRPELGLPGYASAGSLRSAGEVAVSKLLRGEWSHPEATAAAACRMAAGHDDAPVEERPLSKQVGSGKNFWGNRGGSRGPLDTYTAVEGWVKELAHDVWSRLEEEEELHDRVARQLVVGINLEDGERTSRSRRTSLRPGVQAMTADAMVMLRQITSERRPHSLGIVGLSLTADNFVSRSNSRNSLQRMFQQQGRSGWPAKMQPHPLEAHVAEPKPQELAAPPVSKLQEGNLECGLPAQVQPVQLNASSTVWVSSQTTSPQDNADIHAVEVAEPAAAVDVTFPAMGQMQAASETIAAKCLQTAGFWSCSRCTLNNKMGAKQCEACGSAAPATKRPRAAASQACIAQGSGKTSRRKT
eukprot:CAMPEP_0178413966 /NCGR_PEP_ID=MMETSP0689_2-20121128/22796_1 /TAXON_ID=160604 /ORGANISM="Amphidinium massartii, Strain CS-259" /LENGTH=682 /DNA_ID=CAMNT_0020035247 /DNA_START=73 /DNA_END=2118 /DNA_ORIENTATION=+